MTQTIFPLDNSGLSSMTKTGEIPNERIQTLEQFYEFIDKRLVQDLIRSEHRAQFESFINGAKPYSDEMVAAHQLGNICNVNFNVGRDFLYLCMATLTNIVFGSSRLYNVSFKNNSGQYMPSQLLDWGRLATAMFDRLLRYRWRGFTVNMLKMIEQRCMYGRGPILFTQENDWRFTALKDGALLAPKAGSSDIDEWEGTGFVFDKSAVDLYQSVAAEEASRNMGWSPEDVYLAIAFGQGGTKEQAWTLAERYQEFARRQDYNWLSDTVNIKLVAGFMRGFEGEIYLYIAPYNKCPGRPGTKNGGFLCKRLLTADKLSDLIHPFLANIGDTVSWHSIRGEVYDAFPKLVAMNQLICHFFDATRLSSSLQVQYGNQSSQNVGQLYQGAGIINIPNGVEIKTGALPQLGQGPLQALGFFRQFIGGDFSSGGDSEQGKGKDYQSAQRRTMDNRESSQQDLIFLHVFLNDLSHLGRTLWGRAVNKKRTKSDPGGDIALEFIEDMKEAGIPEDVIFGRVDINSAGSANLATAAMQASTMDYLKEFLGRPEINSDELIQTLLCTTVGNPDTAAGFYVRPEDRNAPTSDSAQAQIEDNSMATGGPCEVVPSQNHIVHMQKHLTNFSQNLQDIQANTQQTGQMDDDQLKRSIDLLSLGIPHCQQHYDLARRVKSLKPQADALLHRIQGLENHLKQMQKQYQKLKEAKAQMQAQQQAGGQMDPTTQANLEIAKLRVQEQQEKMGAIQAAAQLDDQRRERESGYKIQEIQAKTMAEFQRAHLANMQQANATLGGVQ